MMQQNYASLLVRFVTFSVATMIFVLLLMLLADVATTETLAPSAATQTETLEGPAQIQTLTMTPSPTVFASEVASTEVAQAVLPEPTTPPFQTYDVQSGDTLYRIAARFNVTVDVLIAANSIADPSLLYVGQRLVIPAVQPATATPVMEPSALLNLPENVIQHVKAVYTYGQQLGNNPKTFAKVGDSITVSTNFLHPVGDGVYDLGLYGYMQPMIDFYSWGNYDGQNAFNRQSLAASVGWSALAALDMGEVKSPLCGPAETPLACEYRLIKPSLALIMFGTNDVGYRSLQEYRSDLLRIIDISEQMGVVPVLSTIPDQPGVSSKIDSFNGAVRAIAADRQIPLWDYAEAMAPLPNGGLTYDNLHPSSPPGGYDQAAFFQTANLRYGYVVRNLTALQMLYTLWWQLNVA